MRYLRLRPSRVFIALLALHLTPAPAGAQLVTAPGAGAGPQVRVIDTNGTERTFFAYHPAFTGGVRIALGDVTGDGIADIVTAPGPGGGPHVRVWNGVDLTEVGGFFAYGPAFAGGVWVAAGDVDGDGRADIITGAGAGGGPHVRIWSGVDFHEIGGFFAYHPAFPGGVSVAAGDVDGDGRADVITGAGAGGGPHVRIWSGVDFHEIGGFFAYHPAFPGGVNVAAGDVNGDGRSDIITGAGPGGGPHVRVWNATSFAEIGGFFAYDPAFAGGIHVAALDLTGDGRAEVITGVGPGGFPISSIWNGADLSLLGSYLAFDPSLRVGVFVASAGSSSALRFTSATSTSFTRAAAGSFTVTTAGGANAPAVTVTGALPAGVTFVDNGNRTATLAGTPAVSGVFPLTFTADNGTAPPVTQSFTLTVSEGPAITSASSATFTAGAIGSSFTITATGSPAPAISIAGALPSGITFTDNDNGTATLAGTAAPGTGGAYPLVITASNGTGTAVQNFTLTIDQGAAITSANAATFAVGAAGSFGVTTSGSPTATTINATGALPAGVTFVNNGNGTATLAGTPGAAAGGTYAITITASNGVGAPAVQNFTLTVNQPPAITSANSTAFTIGQAGSFTVTSTGFPAAGLAAGGAALPSGVTFVDNSNGTGTLAGTPGAGTAGPYALTFTASNAVGSPAVQNFALTVACPVITVTPGAGALAAGTYLQAYSHTFGATGSTGITFSVSAGALPPGLTLAANGQLTGPPSNTGTFNFTVKATDGFACTGSAAYSIAVAPNAANESYTGGVGNTQMVVSTAPFSLTPAVLVVGTVLGNDQGPGALGAGPASIGTTNGGAVALGSNGTFVYTPALGFAGPSDAFDYTLTDGNGITDTATVTIGLSGVVWYVNNSGANGDGRSHSPFNNLTNAQAPSNTGHVIFVHAGVGTTPGAIALKTSQTLWGNGDVFSLNSLSIPPVAAPVLGGSVTLADGVLVRALDISSGAADAISGTNLTGTETIQTVNIIGGATGYNLTNVGGTVNINNGSISGVGGTDVRIIGGNATIAISSPITNTSGRSVNIENRTGGSVGFTAPISDTAQGILLSNNGTTPVLFLGGLTLNTGPNAAFTASGGGRVSATQDNTSIVNTIATTTGTALSLTNYSIGTFGLTFRSISSNGAVNGIVLTNTGTNAGLTITGNGGACASAATCTGGAIQSTTGAGILLTNTANVSLTRTYVGNTGSHGVSGTGLADVTGGVQPTFRFASGLLDSPGDGDNESALFFDAPGATNITGRLVVSDSTIRNFEDVGIHVGNQSGTLTIDVTNVLITNNSDVNGEEGIDVAADGTANITLNVTGTRTGLTSTTMFTDLEGGGINAIVQNDGVLALNISGVVDRGTGGPDVFPTPPAFTFSAEGNTSTLTFDIDDNAIVDASGDGLFIGHEGTIEGRITNNVISGMATGDGIRIDTDTAASTTSTILIQGNTIGGDATFPGIGDDGIQVLHRDGTKVLNLTIESNQITSTNSEAIRYFSDDDVSGGGPGNALRIANNQFGSNGLVDLSDSIVIVAQDPGTAVCAHIAGNSSVEGITLQQSLSAVLQISQSDLVALAAANGVALVTPVGTITFNGGCSNPPLPGNP
jgi:hypothetical protein